MLCGLIQTVPTEVRPSTAVDDFVASATLVAVTLIICAKLTDAGAVNRPDALTEPTPAGAAVQVTAVFVVLITFAVNCRVWPPESVAGAGDTVTEIGKVYAADATALSDIPDL